MLCLYNLVWQEYGVPGEEWELERGDWRSVLVCRGVSMVCRGVNMVCRGGNMAWYWSLEAVSVHKPEYSYIEDFQECVW